MLRRRVLVRGRVQGVWFRDSCRQEAERLRVSGWARNLDDGRVEVVIEGDDLSVTDLERWCHHGPPRALVTDVEAVTEPVEGLRGFHAR